MEVSPKVNRHSITRSQSKHSYFKVKSSDQWASKPQQLSENMKNTGPFYFKYSVFEFALLSKSEF